MSDDYFPPFQQRISRTPPEPEKPRPGALRGRKLTAPKHPLKIARELRWAEAELSKRLQQKGLSDA